MTDFSEALVPPSCLVIGPIGDENAPYGSPERAHYEESLEVLTKMIEPACDAVGITPVRADRMHRPGEIPEQVFIAIRDYDLVIADLSGANPNVMYELALRHAVGKCAVLLSEWKRLPFDVQWLRTIQFVRSEQGLIDARKKLVEAIEAAIQIGCDRVTATRVLQGIAGVPVAGERGPSAGPDQTPMGVEEEPGFLDILAEMEEAMPRLNATIEEMAGVVGQLGELGVRGSAELDALEASGITGVGPRLPIIGRFAAALDGPTDRLEMLISRYASDIERIDKGVSFLLDRLEAEPELIGEAPGFPEALVELGVSATSGLSPSAELGETIATLGAAARSLRAPTHRLAAALRSIPVVSAPIWAWAARASRLAAGSGVRDGSTGLGGATP